MRKETSEEIHGLMKQPAPTCPLIDDITQRMYDIENNINSVKELHDILFSETSNINEVLEKIRDNCILIREWGEEWKTLAIHLYQQGEPVTDFIRSNYEDE